MPAIIGIIIIGAWKSMGAGAMTGRAPITPCVARPIRCCAAERRPKQILAPSEMCKVKILAPRRPCG